MYRYEICSESVSGVKTVKARVAPAIIAAIIGAVATIVVALIAYYGNLEKGTKASSAAKLTFEASASARTQTFLVEPASGKMYVSVEQTAGAVGSQYQVKLKATDCSKYLRSITFTISKNKVCSAESFLGNVINTKKYNCAVKKLVGLGKKSTIYVRWVLK